MTAPPLTDALARAEQRLFCAPMLEAFIARREAGCLTAADAGAADDLAHELIAHQSTDGSWGGHLGLTAEALLLLTDLRPFEADVSAAVERGVAWIGGRRSLPGAWSDACTPDRHANGLCRHFAGGFFSPGARAFSFAGTTLASGARLEGDDDARLALSALALRAVLDQRSPTRDDVLHIDALRRIADLLLREQTRIGIPAAVTVLATLARVPRSAGHLTTVHGAFSRLAGSQRADGSWPGAEMFHVADALLQAVRSGYGSPVFDSALARTAQLLILTQQADGSWGSDAGPYRLLTGWRTLRYVAATGTS